MLAKMIREQTKKFFRANGDPEFVTYLPYQAHSHCYVLPQKVSNVSETCTLGLPIPAPQLWGGFGKKDRYLFHGKRDIDTILSKLKESGRSLENGSRIVDLGCSAGRMIRWLKGLAATCEIWGLDISAEHIIWCKQNLSPPFHFATTTTLPHLPFEDAYFDLMYALSVFTHIDDLADAWLLELHRILKPNALAYITIHDENTVGLLERGEYDLKKTLHSHRAYEDYIKSDYGMFTVGRGISSQVFYETGYFRRMVEPMFKVLSITKEAHFYQTGVLLEKS
jgi:ubiquinone/menaquinone biosynthesis C-methylase UbiE